jgi:hypothetical protein
MNSERAIVCLLIVGLVAAAGCADLQRGEPSADGGAAGAPLSDGGQTHDPGSNDGNSAPLSFARDVHPLLIDLCARCHGPAGQASRTSLVFLGDPARDLPAVVAFTNADIPAASRLLSKAAGTGHEGGALVKVGTPEYRTILAWMTQGSLP